MNEIVGEVIALSHRYSVQWAVKDISLKLEKNKIYGLLGANGAGKSTIMNVLCGVIKPTEGEIMLNGISLSKTPEKAKKHIGFLPQKPPLQTNLTVEEFLTYSAQMRLIDKKDIPSAIDVAMEKCGITHFRHRVISNLSGGYQQRVGIAQSIIHNPDLVVLDEPTNGLDPNQILEVRNLIHQIAKERTVILSTHILQEVQALCDHIWMIKDGEMIFSGSLQELEGLVVTSAVIAQFLSPIKEDELAKVSGVESVDILGDGRFKIKINEKAVIERIVQSSVKNNWRLIEIIIEKTSLESVFARLTK